jgi:hypothetical protein
MVGARIVVRKPLKVERAAKARRRGLRRTNWE